MKTILMALPLLFVAAFASAEEPDRFVCTDRAGLILERNDGQKAFRYMRHEGQKWQKINDAKSRYSVRRIGKPVTIVYVKDCGYSTAQTDEKYLIVDRQKKSRKVVRFLCQTIRTCE